VVNSVEEYSVTEVNQKSLEKLPTDLSRKTDECNIEHKMRAGTMKETTERYVGSYSQEKTLKSTGLVSATAKKRNIFRSSISVINNS